MLIRPGWVFKEGRTVKKKNCSVFSQNKSDLIREEVVWSLAFVFVCFFTLYVQILELPTLRPDRRRLWHVNVGHTNYFVRLPSAGVRKPRT